MGKLRLRRYRPGDEAAFRLRPDFAAARAAVAWDWSKGPPGPTWTLERWNGEICGVGGGVDRRHGRFQVWAQLADLPARDWPQVLWLAARALTTLRLRHGAAFAWANCWCSSPAAALCLRKLGFTPIRRRRGLHYMLKAL